MASLRPLGHRGRCGPPHGPHRRKWSSKARREFACGPAWPALRSGTSHGTAWVWKASPVPGQTFIWAHGTCWHVQCLRAKAGRHPVAKRHFPLADRGAQLGEQKAGGISGPRLTPLRAPPRKVHNAQPYGEDRDGRPPPRRTR